MHFDFVVRSVLTNNSILAILLAAKVNITSFVLLLELKFVGEKLQGVQF